MESVFQKTILIVDDEERNRRLLEVFASADGYRTLSATTGEQGLLLARNELPDLVLLDLMMPGMDGFEVARILKGQAETAGIPLIVVSSLDDAASRGRMQVSGIDKILTKPIDRWLLSRAIAELIQGARAR
ncbi:response regulator [Noviherbaspirillum aerium]|uniref:response regulator n=1 Tax=Noviherbaspirillum aerium TaxID=2588497 RepID=UPI00124D520D|nr:response regulator [Noviherbaspirillum aerium]